MNCLQTKRSRKKKCYSVQHCPYKMLFVPSLDKAGKLDQGKGKFYERGKHNCGMESSSESDDEPPKESSKFQYSGSGDSESLFPFVLLPNNYSKY